MSDSLCGQTIQSRRGLLALTWSLVTFLTILAFVVALGVTISAQNDDQYSSSNDDNNRNNEEEVNPEVAVTSRAMAFAALWTAVLACLMSVFGTVILGFQSPTGQYYTCCSGNVHRTSPLGLGSFIGALLMFSNLTLVCSVLFGEFEIRDYYGEGQEDGQNAEYAQDLAVERSSMAFSILCMFLTALYLGFAATAYTFSHSVLEENEQDDDAHRAQQQHGYNGQQHAYSGYIDNRFDIHPASKPGFVGAQGSGDSGLT